MVCRRCLRRQRLWAKGVCDIMSCGTCYGHGVLAYEPASWQDRFPFYQVLVPTITGVDKDFFAALLNPRRW